MSAQNNFGLSEVAYINDMFPLNIHPDNMPISYHIEDIREVIVGLSETMITQDAEERRNTSNMITKLAATCKLLTEMKAAVLRYAEKV